ncbi:hypothetical protein GS496_14145 [Rhodococcus hoagii]|nr:hypothetical protein [Prescottella equi]
MDDDELRPHLRGLWRTLNITIEEDPPNVKWIQRLIAEAEDEIRRRGL